MTTLEKYINSFDSEKIVVIYSIIDSIGKLHDSGFDLFGSVYERFASNKEKSVFGEFFTRRHYTHIFSKLLFRDSGETHSFTREFKVLDPACGTGGFLTEAYKIISNNFIANKTWNKEHKDFLKKNCFYGFDVKKDNISRARLNMFLCGDGHTHIIEKDSLRNWDEENTYDFILANPPYGNGEVEAETNSKKTKRYEIAFIFRMVKALKPGGKGCFVIPDGFFENPSFKEIRKELLSLCKIQSIVSLPKHAFAPYTGEKTYALFLQKKLSQADTKIQSEKVWFYIIDNDGLANSNKRFKTDLTDENGRPLHDEISFYVDSNNALQSSLLEERWLNYDDSNQKTKWVNEHGETLELRKAGFIGFGETGINEENFFNLLPEFYLRPYEPDFITLDNLKSEVSKIEKMFNLKD